ncbi:MAG: non-homologous end-joining DNA ligase [Fimbriimonadaceae bacterium]|nr:non-homologous end-joining DNA ligase [Fimbriimonadaceae bacterium]
MLDEYRAKRDFAKTTEPSPGAGDPSGGLPRFVVQKHHSRHLHYDLRLEWDGVLKSWAVPKGPSLKRGDKRFAALVEDHPLAYADFEGVIPKEEYGGGEVIVWDRGTYFPDENPSVDPTNRAAVDEEMRRGFAAGKLSFTLLGEKLRGSFALVRMKEGKDWLLLKHQDEYVDNERDVLERDRSVLTGRTIADLQGVPAAPSPTTTDRRPIPGAIHAPYPTVFAPMMATLGDRPFVGKDWVFEPKMDGFRALVFLRDGDARLFSRNGNEMTSQFPALRFRLANLGLNSAVLDGEIVAPDEQGLPSFQRLLKRFQLKDALSVQNAERTIPIHFYGLDLLYLDGFDLRNAPWTERRAALERSMAPRTSDAIHLIPVFEEDGPVAMEGCVGMGFEGIVAKRKAGRYQPGKRSSDWIKFKREASDEFVVVGYTLGQGWRSKSFGSLVLAKTEDDGSLTYVGNVGSGFDDATLESIQRELEPLAAAESPFAKLPAMKEPHVTWVRPEVHAEVKFDSYTEAGNLRAPVFLRLRPDKERGPGVPEVRADAPVGTESEEDIEALVQTLREGRPNTTVKIDGYPVALTNLDKPLWTAEAEWRAFTKREYVVYCLRNRVAMLRHLRDRPLTLTRFPNGHRASHFYQKHWEGTLPPYVTPVRIFSGLRGESGDYMVCNNLATLVWLAQIADLEIHSWYSRIARSGDGFADDYGSSKEALAASALNYPDFMVFDLDPYIYKGTEKAGDEPELNRKAFQKGCEVALWLREILESLGLHPFIKTTGKTGLHAFVPIVRNLSFDQTRSASEVIGQHLLRQHPEDVTLEWAVEKRAGKIFFDYNQNVRGKTLASIYSPRATGGAKVSVPVRWDELMDVFPSDFDISNVPDRVSRVGDVWEDILDHRVDLKALLNLG